MSVFLSHTGNYSGLFSFNTDCTDQHRVFIRLICAIRVHYSAVLKVDPLVCRANPLQQAQSPEEATDNIVMLWLDNATHPGLSMLDGATHHGLSMLDGATHQDCRCLMVRHTTDCRCLTVRHTTDCRCLTVRHTTDCQCLTVRHTTDCRCLTVRHTPDCRCLMVRHTPDCRCLMVRHTPAFGHPSPRGDGLPHHFNYQ